MTSRVFKNGREYQQYEDGTMVDVLTGEQSGGSNGWTSGSDLPGGGDAPPGGGGDINQPMSGTIGDGGSNPHGSGVSDEQISTGQSPAGGNATMDSGWSGQGGATDAPGGGRGS